MRACRTRSSRSISTASDLMPWPASVPINWRDSASNCSIALREIILPFSGLPLLPLLAFLRRDRLSGTVTHDRARTHGLDRNGQVDNRPLLRREGVPVLDADAVVHELYEGDAVAPIEQAFPGTSIGMAMSIVRNYRDAWSVIRRRCGSSRRSCIRWCAQAQSALSSPTQSDRARRWQCSTSRCCSKPAATIGSMRWSS